MTPRLFVRDAAVADLDEAAEWYEARRMGLGGEFLRAVRAVLAGVAVSRCSTHPPRARCGAPASTGFRTWCYYLVEPDGVIVLAVLHGRRDPRVWQSRA